MTQTLPRSLLDTRTALEHAAWYQALSLSERLDFPLPAAQAFNNAPAADLARRRFQRWKDQPPFSQTTSFADRLAMDGLTENGLLSLLGETAEALRDRAASTPPWLDVLRQAFTALPPQSLVEERAPFLTQPLSTFLHPLLPLLEQGYQRLLAGIEAHARQYPSVPFAPAELAPRLLEPMGEKLLPLLIKTFTLELHVARLQGKLEGESAEQRFVSFVQQLNEPAEILQLLKRYPVLARQVVESIDRFVDCTLEMLARLCTDWPEICSRLVPENNEPDILVKIKTGAGDTHRQGRSVVLLTFQSGLRLLYKPRSLAIDTHFQLLLDWLNEKGDHPALRAVRVIDRGGYGWSEYNAPRDCTSSAEVARFYQRLGSYLALLYAFQATDFHFENIIACGEHPMLIDLESLMQPQANDEQNQPLSMEILASSVLRSGLLPRRINASGNAEGIDISGLGGHGDQMTPRPVVTWEAVNTDQMRLRRERVAIQEQQNRPRLSGKIVNMLDYLDDVLAGFTAMYRLLQRHRAELLRRFLPMLASDEIRIILRPTRIYAQLLYESQHPTLLHDTLDRERLLDRIWSARSPGAQVIRAEHRDMLANDIPLFTALADARHLLTSRGECIEDFFQNSGLDTARAKIQQLDEFDLARQVWIIRASFASVIMGEEQAHWKTSHLQPSQNPLNTRRLLQAACLIGDRLCELALCGKGEVSWLSLHLVQKRRWDLFITDWSLYSGVAGISLFLAYLGAVCGEARYTALAQQTLTGIQNNLEKLRTKLTAIGAFDGWGSLLYLLTHLGVLWHNPALLRQAKQLVEIAAPLLEKDVSYDVISGAAGLLRCVLALYRVAPSPRLLAVALQCGQHLQTHAVQQSRGLGWLTPLASGRPLTGLSHGAAGIALCLLELASISGKSRFADTAHAAIEYERSVFSPAFRNWPDLRALAQESNPYGMTAWCHGAPGIGLARLATLAYLDDPAIREEIALALQTTREHGFGMNHSLCHGDLGNLETLLVASQQENSMVERTEVDAIAAMILDSLAQQGWCTGVPLGVETPGLLTGIAGIGYELVRLADPERVPSVLLLEAPHWREASVC